MPALTDIYEDDDDDSFTSASCDESWTSQSGDELPGDDVLVYDDISNNDNDSSDDDSIHEESDDSSHDDDDPKESTWGRLPSEEDGEYSDWKINVTIGDNFEKASYLVHRFKLGPRSDYFQSVFNENCNFAGSREHCCTIQFPSEELPIDLTFDHFERFLDYFYLDGPLEWAEWKEREILALLYLADYFCVNDLREHTLELVRYNIVRTNSYDWMAQAYQLAESLSIEEIVDGIELVCCCDFAFFFKVLEYIQTIDLKRKLLSCNYRGGGVRLVGKYRKHVREDNFVAHVREWNRRNYIFETHGREWGIRNLVRRDGDVYYRNLRGRHDLEAHAREWYNFVAHVREWHNFVARVIRSMPEVIDKDLFTNLVSCQSMVLDFDVAIEYLKHEQRLSLDKPETSELTSLQNGCVLGISRYIPGYVRPAPIPVYFCPTFNCFKHFKYCDEVLEAYTVAKALSELRPAIIKNALFETLKQEMHLERELKRKGIMIWRRDYERIMMTAWKGVNGMETSDIAEAFRKLKPTVWEMEVFLTTELKNLNILRITCHFLKWTDDALKKLMIERGIPFAWNETKGYLIPKILVFYTDCELR